MYNARLHIENSGVTERVEFRRVWPDLGEALGNAEFLDQCEAARQMGLRVTLLPDAGKVRGIESLLSDGAGRARLVAYDRETAESVGSRARASAA